MISPRPRFPMLTTGVAPKKGSLTTKQALLTLLIAMLISGVAGSIELLSHATNMRQETEQRITQQLAVVNGAAAEAAFQLNPDLAHQIAYGLFNADEVAWVSIRDDFGRAPIFIWRYTAPPNRPRLLHGQRHAGSCRRRD